jgi:hypothetical protein
VRKLLVASKRINVMPPSKGVRKENLMNQGLFMSDRGG